MFWYVWFSICDNKTHSYTGKKERWKPVGAPDFYPVGLRGLDTGSILLCYPKEQTNPNTKLSSWPTPR
jgi:hypothetical protein